MDNSGVGTTMGADQEEIDDLRQMIEDLQKELLKFKGELDSKLFDINDQVNSKVG